MADTTPHTLCMELAKRLTAARLQKAWTREMLAEHANINVHTLKRFERTGQVSLERLIAIAQALELHTEIERLFKPRQRIDVNNWTPIAKPARKRGKKLITIEN